MTSVFHGSICLQCYLRSLKFQLCRRQTKAKILIGAVVAEWSHFKEFIEAELTCLTINTCTRARARTHARTHASTHARTHARTHTHTVGLFQPIGRLHIHCGYQLSTAFYITNTHTPVRTALCPGLPVWAGTRKVKAVWILLKQETVSGSGISWAICKQSAPHSIQITMPAPHHAVFAGQMPFLPANQVSKPWMHIQHIL